MQEGTAGTPSLRTLTPARSTQPRIQHGDTKTLKAANLDSGDLSAAGLALQCHRLNSQE